MMDKIVAYDNLLVKSLNQFLTLNYIIPIT